MRRPGSPVLYSRRWAGKPLTVIDLSVMNLWSTANEPISFLALATSPAKLSLVGASPAEMMAR